MLGTFFQLAPSVVAALAPSWHLRQLLTSCGYVT
jgi:hypothetical protein